uniref:Uncharacterized protein n=1 Tax=viral metagenome TaxID=1070528 RepID=A0A6M3IHB1_9ZZZZ
MAIYDIYKSVIDNLEFDTVRGAAPKIINTSGDIYAIVYSGVDNDGWIKTAEITSTGSGEGTISSVIDSLEFAPNITCFGQRIVHISGDIFAIVYIDDAANTGYIVTVEIDSSGNITNSLIDGPVTFQTPIAQSLALIKIASGIYAICYSTDGFDAFVVTWGISDAGTIDIAATDSLEFDTQSGDDFVIIEVGSGVYAIVYEGYGTGAILKDAPMIKTVGINSTGAITGAVIDSFEIQQSLTDSNPSIVNVDGSIYAVSYTGTGSDGFLITISISSAGNIGAAIIDTLEFDTSDGRDTSIVKITGDYYAIAYRGTGTGPVSTTDGQICTVEVSTLGNIGAAILDSFEFEGGSAFVPQVILVSSATSGLLAIVYQDSATDGRLVTIGIGSWPLPVNPVYPADPLTRVTGIIHRYDRLKGIFQSEVSLGDVTSLLEIRYDSNIADMNFRQRISETNKLAIEKASSQIATDMIRYLNFRNMGEEMMKQKKEARRIRVIQPTKYES